MNATEALATVEMDATLWTKAVHYVGTLAHEKLPEALHGRVEMATALVMAGKVHHAPDGTWTVEGSHGERYTCNGTCDCADYAREQAPVHMGKRYCKHKIAQALQVRALEVTMEDLTFDPDEPADVEDDGWPPEEDVAPVLSTTGIDPRFLVTIQGKPFVQYPGLLALAHTRGLVSLTTRIESHSETLVLASATATFQDGRTFTEWADSTPENVGAKVRLHWVRMALTRAKARVLRDALNIGVCSVEELA